MGWVWKDDASEFNSSSSGKFHGSVVPEIDVSGDRYANHKIVTSRCRTEEVEPGKFIRSAVTPSIFSKIALGGKKANGMALHSIATHTCSLSVSTMLKEILLRSLGLRLSTTTTHFRTLKSASNFAPTSFKILLSTFLDSCFTTSNALLSKSKKSPFFASFKPAAKAVNAAAVATSAPVEPALTRWLWLKILLLIGKMYGLRYRLLSNTLPF